MDILLPSSRRGSSNSDSFLESIFQGVRQEFSSHDNSIMAFNVVNFSEGSSPSLKPARPHPRLLNSPLHSARGTPSPSLNLTTRSTGVSPVPSLVLANVNSPCFHRAEFATANGDVDKFSDSKDSLHEVEDFVSSPKPSMFVKNSPKPRKFSLHMPMKMKSLKEIWLNKTKRRHSELDATRLSPGKYDTEY